MEVRQAINGLDPAVKRMMTETLPGLIYGNKYKASGLISVAATSTFYPLKNMTTGSVNGMEHQDPYFRIWTPGKYLAIWNASLNPSFGSPSLAGTVMINGGALVALMAQSFFGSSAYTLSLGGAGILTLAAGDGVSLVFENLTSANDINVTWANISLVWVGP